MTKKSAVAESKRRTRVVRKSAGAIPPSTPRDLERLRRLMESEIDTSDIPERQPRRAARARRTPQGKPVPPFDSAIRDAIRRELGRRQVTRVGLCKRARVHCPTLPASAVYEFLRGERQIGLEYVEALLAAVDLEVRRRDEPAREAR